jgi:cytochrome c553
MKLYTLERWKRSLVVTSAFLLAISFSACEEKKGSDTDESVKTSNSTPKIEIVENQDKYALKVASNKKNSIDGKSTNENSFYYDYDIKSNYDQKAQPANKDAEVSIRPRSVLDAQMNIRSPYERVQISLLSKQLSPTFRLKCSACHDDYANGVLGPSLLGKDADYIYNKIIDFKTGKKSNVFMKDLIHNMSDKDIKIIAQDIYNFNKQIQKIRNK